MPTPPATRFNRVRGRPTVTMWCDVNPAAVAASSYRRYSFSVAWISFGRFEQANLLRSNRRSLSP